MKRKIFSLLLALLMCVGLSLHASASTTKTATAITSTCPGYSYAPCPGGGTTTQTVGPNTPCSSCGNSTHSQTYTKCSTCGATLSGTNTAWPCGCGKCTSSGTTTITGFSGTHNSVKTSCSHGQTTSHSISTGSYQNTDYGYSGTSSTFTVYSISTVCNGGISVTSIKATGATATDYFLNGKTITVTFTNETGGEVTVTLNGSTTKLAEGSTTYSFTMPAKDTTLSLSGKGLQVNPSPSNATLEVGETTQITPNASEGATVTYTSASTNICTVSTTGIVTGKNKGTTTITVKATL